MTNLLYYLLQVAIVSGILYGYYHVALRNKQFHQYNRIYLLSAVILSLVIPFLNIPVYFTQRQAESSVVIQALTDFSEKQTVIQPVPSSVASIEQTPATKVDYTSLLPYCYGLLVLLALIRITSSFLRIMRLRKNNPEERIGDIRFVNTEEPGTPFSFFRWLFWNRDIELRSAKGEQIFRHELFHIRQKHSVDILFLEIVTAIFWINPFFHLMKKELRTIHEFLADRFAVDVAGKWEYAELLLMQVLQTKQSLANPFFNNQVKRRIAMITNSKNTRFKYLRKLLPLSLVLLMMVLFAFSYKAISQANRSEPSFVKENGIEKPKHYLYARNEKIVMEADSIVYYNNARGENFDYKHALFIVNGIERNYDFIKTKSLTAELILFHGRSNKEAMYLYGSKAANGLIVVVRAGIIDTPPDQYFRDIISGSKKVEIDGDKVQNTDGSLALKFSFTESKQQELAQINKQNIILLFSKTFSIRFNSLQVIDSMYSFPKSPELVVINGEAIIISQAKAKYNRSVIASATVRFIPPGDQTAIKKYGVVAEKGVAVFTNVVFVSRSPEIVSPEAQSQSSEMQSQAPEIQSPENQHNQRQQDIKEIKEISRNASEVAYNYKGRTYLFANDESTRFSEQDGTDHTYLINGNVITSIEEVNKRVTRNQVDKMSIISAEEALEKYNVPDRMISIETYVN